MSIKKKIGGAVIATALGASLLAGGSYALFTAEASNSGNTFTAGTVVIDDLNDPSITTTKYFNNLAPGDSESFKVKIKNTGNLDAWVKVKDIVGTGALFEGTSPLSITDNTGVIEIEAGKTKEFSFTYNFPENADNTYQKATGELAINFQAVQLRNNDNDSGPISWE
ncbi:TasA family protein [Ferdinandcohnia sp. Marseille-Q9671]